MQMIWGRIKGGWGGRKEKHKGLAPLLRLMGGSLRFDHTLRRGSPSDEGVRGAQRSHIPVDTFSKFGMSEVTNAMSSHNYFFVLRPAITSLSVIRFLSQILYR